MGDSSVCLQDS